jgi:glycosyltransferase involved in cell wall biosynthesis
VVAVVHHLRCLEPGRAAARRLRRAVERAYLGGVDGVVCNSGHTRGEVARLRPGLLPAVVARPAGDRLGSLDPAAVAARCGEPGPLRLLALGAVVPRKGLLPLLEGLSGLPAAAWRLTVAGRLDADPAHARRVERAARAWPDGQVNFAGRVADEALPDLLAAHQVLALPFSYEGFGIVYAEAMAYGLPCLASTAGGAPEIVGHGATGYLVRPGDLRSLAGHVAGLAGDRALLRRMSLAARQAAGSMPTWADCGRTVRGFLETVAGLRPDRCAFGGTAPAEIFAERTGIGEQ